MKQLTKIFKRAMQRVPKIPQKVMDQITEGEILKVIHRSDIEDQLTWDFDKVVSDYIHENILWKTGEVNNSQISPISKGDAEAREDVLLCRVLWGETTNACYYGVMSFVKFKKKWYFVTSKIVQQLYKLPDFEDCYANVEDNTTGKTAMCRFTNMKELFFTYEEE